MNRSAFVEKMWSWTIIPFAGAFIVSLGVTLFNFAKYLLGASDALKSDSFAFCLFVVICSAPLYGFLLVIRKIVTVFTNNR